MAAQAGCSSWRVEDDEEDDEDDLGQMEQEIDFSNSSLMPPPPPSSIPQAPLSPIPLPAPPSSSTRPETPAIVQRVSASVLSAPEILTSVTEESIQGQESQAVCEETREENAENVPWNLTPEVAVVRILSYLGDVDRCNASLACIAWRRAFRNPCLWRTRHFIFRGYEAMERQEKYSQFLTQFGWHVRHACVELCRPNINTATVIARAFETFVSRLNKCHGVRLLSISFISADFLSAWHFFSHNRGKVVRSLCNLLKKQSCLRSADLSYCLMDRDEGSRVLDALSYGTRLHPKQYLSTLDLRQFFSPGTRAISFTRYGKVMGQFVTLVCVRLDLRSVNENILQTLTKASAKTMRRLELDFYADETVGPHLISPSCWREVAQRSPSLGVLVRIHGLCGFNKYTSVLVKGMPLQEMRLTYLGVEDLSNPELLRGVENLIVYLGGVFSQTLHKVNIQLRPDMEVNADSAVLSLVSRCVHLADLHVNFILQAATFLRLLEAIHKNRAASHLGAKRTRLRLNIRGLTPDLDQSIKRLTSAL